MKLTIIPLVDPTEQQYLDLYKIWTDQTRSQVDEWLDSGGKIYAARFNDRLLGAAKIQLDSEQGIISDFLVREVTRRRGIGVYLLDEICRQEAQITHWYSSLQGIEKVNHSVMTLFLIACGFTATNDPKTWQKQGITQ